MAFEKGVLGQGGPTGPVYPNLPEGSPEMNAVRAGRFVPQPAAPGATPVGQDQYGAGALTSLAVSNTGGWTVPTMPGATAEWKAPDLAAYDRQFAESLSASRSNIANQVQRAMEDIAAQENIANQVVGTLPGRYNEIYDQSGAAARQGLESLYAAQQATGLGNRYGTGLASVEQLAQPMEAAMGMGRSAFQSTVPLTQLGTKELFTKQKGAMEQARLGAEGTVDEASREWIGRRAGIEADIVARENEFKQREAEREAERQRFQAEQTAREAEFRAQQRAENARQQRELSQRQRENKPDDWAAKLKLQSQLNREEATHAAGLKPNEDPVKKTLADLGRTYGPKDNTADRGALIVTGGPGTPDYDAVFKDKDFIEAQRKVTEGKRKPGVIHNPFNRSFGYSVDNIIKDLEKKGKHRSAAVIRHLYSGKEEDRAARTSSLQSLMTG